MTSLPAIRRDLIAKRNKVGAASPIGHRLSSLISLLEIQPADERHAARRLQMLARTTAEIENLQAGRSAS